MKLFYPDYIEFDNVSFSYDNNNEILKHISFTLDVGSSTAIVGNSEKEKMMIFSLFFGLYEPTVGTIRLDSIDISELPMRSLRKSIAIVQKDPFLSSMTIRDNLLLAAQGLSEDAIVQACKMTCIHDEIMNTADGYDTELGADGLTMSVSQKQRLTIAQALLSDSPIILIDEALPEYYGEGRSYVPQILKNISKTRTILVIARRLSTVVSTDKVIAFDGGTIAGIGSYTKLFCTNERFRDICKSAFSAYIPTFPTPVSIENECDVIAG